MDDTEGAEVASPCSEASPPAVASPKKRRTQTTPHQSAVLRALLAKTWFPSRVQREQTGQSIGLASRTVQIWFQNQRQKARLPGSRQSDHSQSGPQRMDGLHLTMPLSYAAVAEHTTPSGRNSPEMPYVYSEDPPSEQDLTSVPGRSSQRGPPILHPAPDDPYIPVPPFSIRWLDSENTEGTLPFRRTPENETHSPLILNQPLRSPDVRLSSSMFARTGRTTPPHASFRPSPPPVPTFAHNPPEQPSYPPPALGLPPPFTLQPQPQWDRSSSHHAPSFSWSRSLLVRQLFPTYELPR